MGGGSSGNNLSLVSPLRTISTTAGTYNATVKNDTYYIVFWYPAGAAPTIAFNSGTQVISAVSNGTFDQFYLIKTQGTTVSYTTTGAGLNRVDFIEVSI